MPTSPAHSKPRNSRQTAAAETAGIERVVAACSSCEYEGRRCSTVGRPLKKDAEAEVVLPVAVEEILAAEERRAFEPVADEMLALR